MLELKEWGVRGVSLAVRLVDVGYGKEGKCGVRVACNLAAKFRDVTEKRSMGTHEGELMSEELNAYERLTIESIRFSSLFWWCKFKGKLINELNEGFTFSWRKEVLNRPSQRSFRQVLTYIKISLHLPAGSDLRAVRDTPGPSLETAQEI